MKFIKGIASVIYLILMIILSLVLASLLMYSVIVAYLTFGSLFAIITGTIAIVVFVIVIDFCF